MRNTIFQFVSEAEARGQGGHLPPLNFIWGGMPPQKYARQRSDTAYCPCKAACLQLSRIFYIHILRQSPPTKYASLATACATYESTRISLRMRCVYVQLPLSHHSSERCCVWPLYMSCRYARIGMRDLSSPSL